MSNLKAYPEHLVERAIIEVVTAKGAAWFDRWHAHRYFIHTMLLSESESLRREIEVMRLAFREDHDVAIVKEIHRMQAESNSRRSDESAIEREVLGNV